MNRNIRTDLAMEATELFNQAENRNQASNNYPSGVEVEESAGNGIKTTRVKIVSENGEKVIGKPMGNYITLEVPELRNSDQTIFKEACKCLAHELESILNIGEKDMVLIVGLGNWNVTPDALGPKVVSSLMVTRHLFEYVPEQIDEGIRSVSAIAPGVLGITGIETGEIIKGIIDKIKPSLVIAIDALASRKAERISTTIQIADTGITPGSGIGNKRMELSKETLGVPVIAIGVPTVIDAATMVSDTIEILLEDISNNNEANDEFNNILASIHSNTEEEIVQKMLFPTGGNLMVTPKEIDEIIEKVSKVIANGLNMSLHKGIDAKDVNDYLH